MISTAATVVKRRYMYSAT
jgi:hypothetical protein